MPLPKYSTSTSGTDFVRPKAFEVARTDLVTGKNSFFRPPVEHPVRIIAKDFDNNGSIDPIVTYYNPVKSGLLSITVSF
jgi:hypothetical protein